MRILRDTLAPRTKPSIGSNFVRSDPLAPYVCVLVGDGAGTSVFDVALGQRSNPAINVPVWTENNGGPALRFTATSSQSVRLQQNSLVSSNNVPFTIAVLFRTTDAGTTAMGLYAEGSSTSAAPLLFVNLNSGLAGRVQSQLRDDSSTLLQIQSDLGLNDGKWHTIHLVNEGAGGNLVQYVDGISQASVANTLGSVLSVDTSTFGANEQNAGPTSFLTGDVGFVMAWKRRLSAQEVMQHARAPYSMFWGPRVSGRELPGLTEWRIQDTSGADLLISDKNFPINLGEEILEGALITKVDEYGAYVAATEADSVHLYPWSNIKWITPADKVFSSPHNTLQNRSGTIVTPNVSQQVMAANPARQYLSIENVSDTVMWMNFTTVANADQPSIQLFPGSSFPMEGEFVTSESVNIICETSGKAYTALEA